MIQSQKNKNNTGINAIPFEVAEAADGMIPVEDDVDVGVTISGKKVSQS